MILQSQQLSNLNVNESSTGPEESGTTMAGQDSWYVPLSSKKTIVQSGARDYGRFDFDGCMTDDMGSLSDCCY